MITYSSIILIILAILLLVVISMKVTFTSSSFNFKKNLTEKFTNNDANVVLDNNKSNPDGIKSLFNDKLLIMKTNNYDKIFSNGKYYIWAPKQIDNYLPVSHYLTKKNKKPTDFAVLVNSESADIIKPDKYNITAITNNNFGIWNALSNEEDYASLGTLYSKEYPSRYSVRMVNKKFLIKSDVEKMIVENNFIKRDKGYELWNIQESPYFVCNNRNNVNEFESVKNIYTFNNNLLDVNKKLYIKYTLSYKKILKHEDEKLGKNISIWRPIPPKNFYSLGDIVVKNDVDPNNLLQTVVVHKSFCKFPLNYGTKPVIRINKHSIWKPVAPDNYYFLGQVLVKGKHEPNEEDLIACIPVDYLEKTKKTTTTMVWNNINERNPASIWMSSLNLLSANNKYVPPETNGVVLMRNLTTSDIDLMDTSKSIIFKYKKNNKYNQPANETYIKNLMVHNISQKFDITEDRLSIDKINMESREITMTVLPRKINNNSITVDDTVKTIEKALGLGDIRIYTEDKLNYIIKLENAALIKENLNEVELDNSDYIMSF